MFQWDEFVIIWIAKDVSEKDEWIIGTRR